VSARRGGVQGEDFFKSKEDALAWATGDKPLDDDVLEVAPASPQPRLTQDSPSDDEEASQRRMSCPIEALGLGDTPRWPVFRNSPVPFDESYGDRAQAKKTTTESTQCRQRRRLGWFVDGFEKSGVV